MLLARESKNLGITSPRLAEGLLHSCYTRAVGHDHQICFKFRIGSGTGIRNLNLAVNRSLQPVQNWRPELAECR